MISRLGCASKIFSDAEINDKNARNYILPRRNVSRNQNVVRHKKRTRSENLDFIFYSARPCFIYILQKRYYDLRLIVSRLDLRPQRSYRRILSRRPTISASDDTLLRNARCTCGNKNPSLRRAAK